MEQIAIRYAESYDYAQVEMIKQQVQDMHVNWRPDIYKRGDCVLPPEIFDSAVQNKEFIVAEGYRGQGAGHSLFEFARQIWKQRNLDGIELVVNARNLEAKAMYEKYGFTEKSINMELL